MKEAFEMTKSFYAIATSWVQAHPAATINILVAAAVIRLALVFV